MDTLTMDAVDTVVALASEALGRAIDLAEREEDMLELIVSRVCNAADLDNPYSDLEAVREEAEDEKERLLEGVLRDVRAAIKASDSERALLLIHYELGDY